MADLDFLIDLEHIRIEGPYHLFRVAFSDSSERLLLPYPACTGLQLTPANGNQPAEWKSRYLVSSPHDDFVLDSGARIAFDIRAYINSDGGVSNRWSINLSPGRCKAQFVYQVDRDEDWYDFLAKRSRFAAMTKLWRGAVISNITEFNVPK